MSLIVGLVPLLSLLALILLYFVLIGIRGARVGELKRDHEAFTRTVLEEDAALQSFVVLALMEGQSPPECLAGFEKKRAELLPGVRLEDPAGWDSDELAEYARSRFADRLGEVNRKLFTGGAIIAVAIIAVTVTVTAVIYQFNSGSSGQSPTPSDPAANTPEPPAPADSNPLAAPTSATTSTDPAQTGSPSQDSPSRESAAGNTENTPHPTTK
jgi:hypothetical protein